MDNWVRKDKGSSNYGSRGVWRGRSSNIRRPPLAGPRSVPSWEKKFCESICLIPWHKLLEAKKFMHLYENVVKWNDTAAEEAFKNAKNRFWAEINDLPCNIKFPDPDIYIDNVDWNSKIDPELLLDLERGPDMDSKTSEAESDTLIHGNLFMLDSQNLYNNGWGNLDEVPVPEPPTESAGAQGWINWDETVNTFSSNNKTDQYRWDVEEDLDRSKGWNNWDDDDADEKDNKYASKFNWDESGCKNSWDENIYGNGNMENGGGFDPWQGGVNPIQTGNRYGGRGEKWNDDNCWGHAHYSSGKNVAIDGVGVNPCPPNNHWRRKENGGYDGGIRAPDPGANWTPLVKPDGYWPNRGFKNSSRGRKRQDWSRCADRRPSYGRW